MKYHSIRWGGRNLSRIPLAPTDVRIQFKIMLLTYKSINGLAPSYITELIERNNPSLSLDRNLSRPVLRASVLEHYPSLSLDRNLNQPPLPMLCCLPVLEQVGAQRRREFCAPAKPQECGCHGTSPTFPLKDATKIDYV